jgi:hypothetical protein
MASTINASTSAGLVSTADTSGVLQLQTAGTAAVTVDASQNVGIGTASPVNKLVVSNAGAAGFEVNPSDASGVALASYNRSGAAYANLIYYASNQIFCTGGTTEGMRLTSTGLGIGTSSPNASAILDTQSTTKGVRMPNMTTTQKNAIASPAAGLMVFDTTLAKLCVYSGSAWQTITSV